MRRKLATLTAAENKRWEQLFSCAVNSGYAHQRAVNSLLELAVYTPELRAAIPDAELSVPMNQVPALFRAAITEQKVNRRNPRRQETAILETALTLLEQAKSEDRTPEQEEFYSALTWECVGAGVFRVKYVPGSVTVN